MVWGKGGSKEDYLKLNFMPGRLPNVLFECDRWLGNAPTLDTTY